MIEAAEAAETEESALGPSTERDPSGEIAARWAKEFAAYFRGERRTWSPDEIGLERYGFTPFQAAVYRALMTVPPGAVVSYGELARLAGYPRAARAVGTVMATNPIAVVVPCHRVVRSDGSLGHYGFGDAWKPLLLSMEGSMT
ncbi:MAG: MGMT family protein [Actinobacteria bacterium]|nr:MGMT family protein [Actinomycetota bacterium]